MKFWLKPIADLQKSMKSLLAGDFRPLSVPRKQHEIHGLVHTFNLLVEGVQQRERKILQTAYRDGLTALPNRTLYQERLNEAIQTARQSGRPLTVLLVDLDQFKTVNETLGHVAGDAFFDNVRFNDSTVAPAPFPNAAPEPSTFALLGLAVLAGGIGNRRRRAAAERKD